MSRRGLGESVVYGGFPLRTRRGPPRKQQEPEYPPYEWKDYFPREWWDYYEIRNPTEHKLVNSAKNAWMWMKHKFGYGDWMEKNAPKRLRKEIDEQSSFPFNGRRFGRMTENYFDQRHQNQRDIVRYVEDLRDQARERDYALDRHADDAMSDADAIDALNYIHDEL